MLRVVIVDDEVYMRQALRKALEEIGGLEVLGEAADGNEAVRLVVEHNPDCVFMDVEMPGCDGVEAARQMLDISPKLRIVFITAHQQYMPQAFELYAFDYMVKPFKLSRLAETIARMTQPAREEETSREPLYFKTKGGTVRLKPEEIFIIQRENRQTVIITENERHVVFETLSELEEILPSDIFLRSHKSYIVNIQHIKSILPYGRWTYVVKFHIIKDDALINREKAKELDNKYAKSIFER